jgi:hypothetical protein
MSKMRQLTAAAALAVLPAVTLAHPGHGTLSGMLHSLEPVHALPLIGLLALGACLYRRRRSGS